MYIGYVGSDALGHYIGRGGKGQRQSALANPYPVQMGRQECVKAFRQYAKAVAIDGLEPTVAIATLSIATVDNFRRPSRTAWMAELESLQSDTTLLCFCYREPVEWQGTYAWHCHGEVVCSLWHHLHPH